MKKFLIFSMLIASASAWSNDEEKAREIRDRNLKRMQEMAGPAGATTLNNGPSYAEKIRNAIKPNIVFKTNPKDPRPNLRAIVLIELEENGLIKSRNLISSSGDGEWDASVLNALDKTQRFPLDNNGKVPPRVEISFYPFDK